MAERRRENTTWLLLLPLTDHVELNLSLFPVILPGQDEPRPPGQHAHFVNVEVEGRETHPHADGFIAAQLRRGGLKLTSFYNSIKTEGDQRY